MPAAADPDVALQIAKTVADIYGDAATRMLETVAKRLANGLDDPGWAEAKLVEIVGLRNDAQAIVDRISVLGPDAVLAAVEEGYAIGAAAAAEELDDMADTAAEVSAAFGRTNQRAVQALARETIDSVSATHRAILRSTVDVYRAVIAETSAPGVVTGTETRRQATQRALNRFADHGITGFVDKAGRKWELESYAEMATRTATGRAQVAGHLDRYVDSGRDLVIVSNAPEECKVCRRWEGTVLSITGNTPGYPTVDEARRDGLLHANCRHRLGAYIEGLTEPMTHTADPHGDTIRQEQRQLEREKRKWKRREAVALDDTAKKEARAQVAVFDGHLALIVEDRHAYAVERARFLAEHGHPRAKLWAKTAEGIPAGTEGKRLRYREQITKAR